jgi:hypothetical protein
MTGCLAHQKKKKISLHISSHHRIILLLACMYLIIKRRQNGSLIEGLFVSQGMEGWNKSSLDSFNNYYKFWRFGINPGLFQQKRTDPGRHINTALWRSLRNSASVKRLCTELDYYDGATLRFASYT